MKKEFEYASALTQAIGQVFDENSEFYIDNDELAEGQNLTDFIHALANIVPTMFYNNFTGDNRNNLEFNHLANKLCFQYSNKVEEN